MTFPVIDAHQHVWDPARAEYAWLGPELAPINTAMSFEGVAPELQACGVGYTVQVQSADNAQDTALMRASAAAHPEVVGVVGYAPLDDAAAAEATLNSWADDSLMVGVRILIHNKPDPDWLLRSDVADGLAMLQERNLTFDVVAELPRHLEIVPILAERFPDLRMVIDHLGKPPVGLDGSEPWHTLIAEAAACPNVYGKVSGLYSATGELSSWTTDTIRPSFERAVEVFGARRLMYGGDWPVSILAGGYTRVWNGLKPLFDSVSEQEREWMLGRTAAHFYRLDPQRFAAGQDATKENR
ncbi:amidohydrolase family protein [Microbacterium sp. R86528]|uniref:amidohydrolase family protein n=1 Tax=Microbacterium sp. R86528 TaxID=3093864 RepID=UPI0037CB5CC6